MLLLEQSNLMQLVCMLALIVQTAQSDDIIIYFQEKPVIVRTPQSDDIIIYFQEKPVIVRTPQSDDIILLSGEACYCQNTTV